MALFEFFRRVGRIELRWMLLLAAVAGLANALLIVTVNEVAGLAARGNRPDWSHVLIFVGIFVAYYQFDKIAILRATVATERLLKDLRSSVVDKLRCSELQVIDKLGRGNLYATLAQGTNQLSITLPLLMENFQQLVLLVVSLAYLGYLSMSALLLFLSAMLVVVLGYWRFQRAYSRTLEDVVRRQAEMLDSVGDIIDGGKELRLSTRRSEAVFRSYRELSRSTEDLLARSGEQVAGISAFGNLMIYFMLGVVVFIFPKYIGLQGVLVYQLVPTLLFCVNPISRIVANMPSFVQADVSLKSIVEIERQLETADSIAPSVARALAPRYRGFQRIDYGDITFSFRDASGDPVFTSGPADLQLRRGEIVFLVGGNGSGKSTLVRVAMGLYRADGGRIEVDGERVEGRQIAGLRESFSAVLSDFHLFDRLYGLEDVDPAEVTRLIGEMNLSGKVSYEGGRFSDLQLSTGERKRLALVDALLEDRPVYVFDEWAAEQDVGFRETFYTRIIPGLKARGKTVLAVTHDDRFWHLADRVIRLDLGKVVWERAGSELGGEGT